MPSSARTYTQIPATNKPRVCLQNDHNTRNLGVLCLRLTGCLFQEWHEQMQAFFYVCGREQPLEFGRFLLQHLSHLWPLMNLALETEPIYFLSDVEIGYSGVEY